MTKPSGQPSVMVGAIWPPLSPAQRRTLVTVFRHPIAHNLEWREMEALLSTLGTVDARGGGEFVLHLGQEHHTLHKPRTKDIPAEDVMALRRLLQRVGITDAPAIAEPALEAEAKPAHPMSWSRSTITASRCTASIPQELRGPGSPSVRTPPVD